MTILKPHIKLITILLLTVIAGYFALGYLSSYVGWYGYKKWKHRVGSTDISESKRRGVFVKELNFKVEGYSGQLHGFKPFIERGYKYDYHTSEETAPLTDTDYLYQLSFQYKRNQNFGVLILDDDLNKFDSSDAVWGYLRYPKLSDTITLQIGGEGVSREARIKVW